DTAVGSAAADRILAGLGTDSIDAAAGDDVINGGGGLDTLSGGLGLDLFVYTTLTDAIIGGTSSLPRFERISDFKVGEDSFDLTTVPLAGSFKTLGAVSALTVAGIGSLLNSSNFLANGAATFTFGSGAPQRTFIAFNNSVAGYSSTSDAIVEITGVTYAANFNSLSQISLV
ncbi:MAG: bluetail domain-containing putative surface protein, partial [Synechococcaceae cyanobacterium]|nr:bluetail domain-containing putative surface protein [Synechococcaceae cyanobacterium]